MNCKTWDLRLADGTSYLIICTDVDIDKLESFIGQKNIASIDENCNDLPGVKVEEF